MKKLTLLLIVVLFAFSNINGQDVPHKINYQGVLKNAAGSVVPNGEYILTFKFYNVESGGSELWSETKPINVVDGIIGTQLGSATPIPLPIFYETVWLGIAVGTENEFTPRIALTSVPYSFISMSVPDGSLTAVKIDEGQIVKSLNGLRDGINLLAGSNITITPNGNDLTISATGGSTGEIGGSGTANYLPLFTNSTTLGNSIIYQTGGNLGIGTTTPTVKLELAGSDAKIYGLTVGRGGGSIGSNVALGFEALFSNTTGTNNTAVGLGALYNNKANSSNTAIGNGAMYFTNNTEVSSDGFNTAVGFDALRGSNDPANNTGTYNTAVGSQSLQLNTTGYQNTASGFQALYSNTTGFRNTANGFDALHNNTTGDYNTANGGYTLYDNTTGYYNTAVGYYAGNLFNISHGTFIGFDARSMADNIYNVSCFGYNSRVTAINQIRFGNGVVTSIGGYVGWTNLSDGRYKIAITENVKGLDFIMKLRPITYRLDMNKLASALKEDERRDKNGIVSKVPTEIDIQARNEKSQIVYTGFVAQEVEKAAKELGFNFSGIDAPKNENDFYGLRYAEFVVPLVKAVQEQQKIIEELKKRIEELERK